MTLRFPPPLRPGDRIGVTSPSAGVGERAQARIAFSIEWLRRRGYDVVVGDCMSADRWVSAPKEARAAELTAMLTDPTVRAVVPPWGGAGTALDLLDQLDYDALAAAEPTWVVGYSDSTAWMVPLTLRAGLPTLHGDNLADTPYTAPAGLTHWLDLAESTGPVTQHDSHVVAGWHPLATPTATTWKDPRPGTWQLHGTDRLDATGTLIGGCIEVLAGIAGTPYADVRQFGTQHGDLVVYLEAADDDAYTICRNLHHLRYTGWFDHATTILLGRTNAPAGTGDGGMTQHEAALDALGGLDIPIVLDVEIGHVPPHLPLLNGATAHVTVDGDHHEITQTWPRAMPQPAA
ncbi:S66 family peptidase [Xylanimonas protaetiae]|uniref:LD-carboxypeptidase n=1 Tax=Xylanimonas protaetiae TaxID=2509457 RepID=A0A4P6FK94_9MICO|nr:S66 peptidase family protein [Xylanimonas protaetiae]QAY71048.1 LD-carboxypeptidase [Xylanimonas protaetiae]